MRRFLERNKVAIALFAIGAVFSMVVGFKSARSSNCPSCLPGMSCPVPQGQPGEAVPSGRK